MNILVRNSPPLSVVIIGCGRFGIKRLIACQEIPEHISVVAIVDTNSQIRSQITHRFGVPSYAILADVLKNHQVDAAIVATPNNTHAHYSNLALENHLHVLCEKPIATNITDAQTVVDLVSRGKHFFKLGSNHRFFPSIIKALQLCQKGEIGLIKRFHGIIGHNGTSILNTWFFDKSIAGGGTFIDNGSHLIDLAQVFMGKFTSCFAYTDCIDKKKTVEDFATALLFTKQNRCATITSSWNQRDGYLHIWISGTEGEIEIDNNVIDCVTRWRYATNHTQCYQFTVKAVSMIDELKYFVHCVQSNQEPHPNVREALQILTIISAAYQSAESHSVVNL